MIIHKNEISWVNRRTETYFICVEKRKYRDVFIIILRRPTTE